MLPSDSIIGLSSIGSIVFSYADEYSDENLIDSEIANDFESAETNDDFADFDDDMDLYGDYDNDDETSLDMPL
ncbi:MAG: hypothetical protein J6Y36_09280 [Treponema sp.]|uniref:hypothetical protein n=1 Tax=Treponema sp. TaxID=166 RepID=UPI001B5B8723|nr:hypothetical protein [Treponema sp.]MBP5403335.1 hypothetical protein [Treponema sp.]MBR5932623.1 hypothetical protein [Treponema sp.]